MSANERQPNPCFSFTEREKLYDHVTHNRFLAIVMQPDVDIHEIKEDSNSFGEYLFVTISCRAEQPKKLYTFWGLGYHEHRERLIVDSWQWFESQRKAETLPALAKAEVRQQITEREDFVRANSTPSGQSPRAKLYELLADLTDEDGALSELDDLDSLGWSLLGGGE
ncbi:MAG: hypothetical protein HS103_07980 [Anaerolineales bacterium]|nr:hypothetical protein [Anaerolineales bacterium]